MEGYLDVPVDVHHLVDKGTRKHSGGHWSTLPLCPWHHRGIITDERSQREIEAKHGPSLKHSKKAFIERYGTERHLLGIVDELLSLPLFQIRERLALFAQQASRGLA